MGFSHLANVKMVPRPSHVTTHFVLLDRIAVRLDRLNNILNNAYCSLCSLDGTLSRDLAPKLLGGEGGAGA
jgi:hypothetical protein